MVTHCLAWPCVGAVGGRPRAMFQQGSNPVCRVHPPSLSVASEQLHFASDNDVTGIGITQMAQDWNLKSDLPWVPWPAGGLATEPARAQSDTA